MNDLILLAAEEPMISEALLKYLVGGLVVAIIALCGYIKYLLGEIKTMNAERIAKLEKDLERAHRHKSFVRSKTAAGDVDVLTKEEARELAMAESQAFKLPPAVEVAKRKKMGAQALRAAKLEAQLQQLWTEMQDQGLAP